MYPSMKCDDAGSGSINHLYPREVGLGDHNAQPQVSTVGIGIIITLSGDLLRPYLVLCSTVRSAAIASVITTFQEILRHPIGDFEWM